MTQAYKLSILYFLAFSLLLTISGIMLFEHKIGFNINAISNYYLGDEEKFIVAKTSMGILKIVLPHLFAFGLFFMVLLHFLVFTKDRGSKGLRVLIFLTFFSAFLEVFSPFFIILGAVWFSYVKVASFIILESLVLYIMYLLFHSIIKD